jgi:CrcB protein
MIVLGILLMGALGATARDFLDRQLGYRLAGKRFPLGIFGVNILGAFLLGLLVSIQIRNPALEAQPIFFWAGFGFLGSFTTFSTWMWQSLELLQERPSSLPSFLLYWLGMSVLGLLSLVVGIQLGL